MSATLAALLGYVLWTMLLLFVVINWRGVQVLFGGKRIDAFPADRQHEGPSWYQRLQRAHLNCLENLPLFAVVALVAAVTGRLDITDALAPWVLYARIAQSTIHLLQVHPQLIWLRFAAFLVQFALTVWMAVRLLGWG